MKLKRKCKEHNWQSNVLFSSQCPWCAYLEFETNCKASGVSTAIVIKDVRDMRDYQRSSKLSKVLNTIRGEVDECMAKLGSSPESVDAITDAVMNGQSCIFIDADLNIKHVEIHEEMEFIKKKALEELLGGEK